MAKLIKAINAFDQKAQKSYLTVDVASGGTVLGWDNSAGFRASWAIQAGATGQEKTEILLLGTATPAGTAGTTTAASVYAHPQDTPVYAVFYDQLIFKKSTSGTSSAAVAIANGTVNITPDSKYTTFYDTNGEDSHYYRVTPYNSVIGTAGVDSDWLSVTGYDFYSLRKMRERAKNKLHNSNFIKNDEVLNDWVNEWLETMNNTAVEVNKDYSLGTTSVDIGTSGLGTITDTNFKDIRKVEFTVDNSNYYVCTRMSVIDFERQDSHSLAHPYFYPVGDNVIGIKPDDTAGTAYLHYYVSGTVLSNDTDTLPVVMRPYSKSFVDYIRAQAAYLDNDSGAGDRYMTFANSDLDKFKREISPRHKTGTKYVQIESPTSGEYGDVFTYWW